MVRNVPVVDAHDPIVTVWQRLHDLDSPVAVVCDGTRVVAVVSQRTLAMWWPSGGPCEMCRRQVRDFIDPGIPTVHPPATVRKAAGLINNFGLEGVPVVAAGGALLGVVTPTAPVRLLAETTPDDHPGMETSRAEQGPVDPDMSPCRSGPDAPARLIEPPVASKIHGQPAG
jgi:CBS domain-containing protein